MIAPGVVVVAGIVWDREGERILIARRRPADEHGGMWEFPGGRVREGEGEEEALLRELEEELGVSVEVITPLIRITHAYAESTIVLQAFHCQHTGGSPSAIDCAEWRWVPPDRLSAYPFSPPDRRIIPLIRPLERDL